MRSSRQSNWRTWLIFAVVIVAIVGIGVTIAVIQNEGVEGLWNRKKQWIEKTQPGVTPVIENVEGKVRSETDKAPN